MFARTGFSSCQGSPLLINYRCHLLGAGLKPVNSLVGLPAENGQGRVGEQHSYLSHALALGRPGRNSSSARANSSTLPRFNARPSRLFCEVYFLCSRFYFAAHQGVVCMAISTFITTCDLDACKGGASGEDQVKLMAVLRSWVSPEDSVLGAWY